MKDFYAAIKPKRQAGRSLRYEELQTITDSLVLGIGPRRFVGYEWFYPFIDRHFYTFNEFESLLSSVGLC
jgi:hypothetical protein